MRGYGRRLRGECCSGPYASIRGSADLMYRFNPCRWLSLPPNTSPSSTNFSPFGAGTRICLGLHLALMELRLATAVFFRELRGAKLADKTTPESMGVVNFFLIRPKDDRCYIEL